MATSRLCENFSILSLFVLYFLFTSCNAFSRKISIDFNPGCNVTACQKGINGSFANLVHITAVGRNDALHYVTSSIGKPTLLMAKIPDRQLKEFSVDWEKLLSHNTSDIQNSIVFDPPPVYSYALVFTKLIEYNDTHDDSTLDKAWTNTTTVHNFTDFQWKNVTAESNKSDNTVVFKTTSDSKYFQKNGSISFKIKFYSTSGREGTLPHLLFDNNVTMLDFFIDGLKPRYKNSRFAVEMAFVTSDKLKDKMTLKITKSLDDEYTPGVFKLVDWRAHQDSHGGYLQWKPVCYKSNPRTMADSTFARDYNLKNLSDIPLHSVAYAFYGEDLSEKRIAVSVTNVSFGLSADGFYTGTNYTAWTASLGYGKPAAESVSVLVIAIIAAGLGAPVIIIILGGIFLCVKKRQGHDFGSPSFSPAGYTPINT